MKVIADGDEFELGTTEATPTIGIIDYSRRVTDDFGVTTVVERGFARRMSVRLALPFADVSNVQRTLAALRATPAQWVADPDTAWLNFEGFYKDFEIDLAVPPTSFCTLTVEGLAETETVTDAGQDPAPGGTSTLLLLQPVTVAGAAFVSSNVPETDWPAWEIGTSYPLGARVIKTATHRIYESVVAGNIGNDPAGMSGKWLDIGPTNRWAMFDEALGTLTSRETSIAITVNVGVAKALALLDVVGATVRVQTTGYDQTAAVADGAVTFLDLPGASADVTITISGSGTVSAGTLLIGNLVKLGVTGESPTAGITDYSRKEVDDFGAATIVERAWAKRMSARALISTAHIDRVANRIAAVRAKPSLWIADDGTDALTIWGFFKDFSIERGENVSVLSLSVEGLSEAMPIVEAFEGLAVVEKSFYKRSAEAPATPTGGSFNFDTLEATPPAGWTNAVTDGDHPAWVSSAIAAKESPGGSADFAGHTAPAIAFRDGAPGTSPPLITVASTHQTFRYDTTDAPISQTTTITATRQNTAGTTEWQLRKADGTVIVAWTTAASMVTNGGAVSAPNNDTLSVAEYLFDYVIDGHGTSGLIYEARISSATGVQDRISIVKVQDGAAGAAGAPGTNGTNGQTFYTWYAYADAPNGSFNFTTGSPGNRQYQGVAYDKTTGTESTDPADYSWSDYVGPPNFGLANFNSNTVLAGNKLIKVAGGGDWNASVHSTESFKNGASVSFVVDDKTKSFAVGLNTDPTTDAGRDSIDFSIFCDAGGMRVYEGGTHIGGFGSFANGDVGTITYNDKTVVYSKNGTPFYTNNSPPDGLALFLDSSIYSPSAQVGRILSFTAAGTAGADGVDGTSPVSAVAVPANKQFTAESDGTIKNAGTVLPFNVAIDGMKAGASISGTVTILAVSGCTATAISGGFTIDTVTADAGFVSWRFTASDGQIVENKMSFSRQRDPASGGQVSVNFSSTSWWGSDGYGSSGPSTVLPASSTGKLGIAGYASFYCSGNGEARLTARLQYRAVGSGTWIDSGFTSGPSAAIKTPNIPGEPGENTPGEVSPGGTLTGLTANGSYEVQMVGSRNASYNAIAAASGFITLRQVL